MIQSVREMKSGGTRAVFLPHYWFGVLVRMVQLRKQMTELVGNLWQYIQEVSYGDALIDHREAAVRRSGGENAFSDLQ